MLSTFLNQLPRLRPCFGSRRLQRSLVQLAGRQYLPGSKGKDFPAFLSPFRDNYPFILEVSDDTGNISHLGEETRPKLDKLIQEYPAVLLRGMPLSSAEDFSEFFRSLRLNPMPYIGGAAIRNEMAESVYTASNDAPEVTMEPHNEMSYLSDCPHLIFFYCQTPPEPDGGGHSTLTDVRDVLRDLSPDVVEKFNRLGLRYTRWWSNGEDLSQSKRYGTWQEGTGSDNREVAEEKIRDLCDGFKWEEDGSLSTWRQGSAMRRHYRTGEMLWFNQANVLHSSFFEHHPSFVNHFGKNSGKQYPLNSCYGDGSPIEDDVLQHLRNVTWKHTVGGQLKKSDVLILDNMFIQHARISFTSPRVLYVGLAKF